MINSVSSGANFQPMQRPQAEPLTSEQTELMNETLAQFDPENLTAEDAQSIMQTFKDAGIQPGQEMETIISEVVEDAPGDGAEGQENPGKSLDYAALTSVLTKAIQEQQTIIEDLKSRIETLEG